MDLSQRLDEMELAIHKPSFRKGTGRANEVNYWVFDPESSFPEISSGCRRSYFLSTMKSRQYLAVTVTDLRRNFT